LVKVSGKYLSEYRVANLCKEDPDIGSSVFSEDKACVCVCVCVYVNVGVGGGGVSLSYMIFQYSPLPLPAAVESYYVKSEKLRAC